MQGITINLRKTVCRNKGLKKNFLKVWYKSVIVKKLAFRYEVFFGDLRISGLNILRTCKRMGFLSIAKAYRPVSTNAICVVTGIPPLSILLKHTYKKYNLLQGYGTIETDAKVSEEMHLWKNCVHIIIHSNSILICAR